MDALLNKLERDGSLSDEELSVVVTELIRRLRSELGTNVVADPNPRLDQGGAFPGIHCKARSPGAVQPFGFQWCGLLSLDGYDNDRRNWHINACVHIFVFVNGERVTSKSGTSIRLSLKQSDGQWRWTNEGWVDDENDEFDGITESV